MQERLTNTIKQLADESAYSDLCHTHFLGEPMPSIRKLELLVIKCRQILFPGYFSEISFNPHTIEYYIGVLVDEVLEILTEQIRAGLCFECHRSEEERVDYSKKAKEVAYGFIERLPELRTAMSSDVEAAFNGDPASPSPAEVIFCYPAIRAISNYRIAHLLNDLQVPLIPRIITEMAHSETGIDIHPKAQIGRYFTIDHGTGVVIGSTCIIGNNVKLFQGVTLGAKSFPLDTEGNPIKGIPRHPIVEDDVVIYSNATVLGRITIGKGSTIGGNVWVTKTLPANSRVLQGRPREERFSDGGGI